jgi:hypothetical protein
MRWKLLRPDPDRDEAEVIAGYGTAKLVKRGINDYELVGGTESDRTKLKEWIALFMKGARIRGLE